MAKLKGWVRIRRWFIPPKSEPVIPVAYPRSGARPADKQSLVRLTEVTLPIALTERPSEPPSCRAVDTTVDEFTRSGLTDGEVRLFVDWLGGHDRVVAVLAWVGRAHQRLELLEFPNFVGDVSIAMLREAHPTAVRGFTTLLEQLVVVNPSVPQTYALLRQRLPGIELPAATNRADLAELIAVARTLHLWCAQRGTLPCGCR